MKLKVVTVPNPVLRKKSQPIKKLDKKSLQFIKNLEQTLKHHQNPPGVGLSAVQVNRLLRVFCTYLPDQPIHRRQDLKKTPPVIKTYINPQIITQSKQLTLGPNKKEPILEGCLSIPKIYGPVPRHHWIKLQWQTPTGQSQTAKFSDFTARVIQHEHDHLNGILFTDHSLKHHLPIYEDQNGRLIQTTL